MSRSIVRLGAILLVALMAIGAFAGEGRIPIYQFPTTITASGKYVVTRNLGPAASGTVIIDVQASDVDIDLNGFALSFSSGPGIAVQVIGQQSVAIRNGSIRAGKVFVTGSQKIIIEDLRIDDSAEEGIFLEDVTSFAVRRNHVVGAGIGGIMVKNPGGNFSQGVIEGNLLENCGAGIEIDLGGSIEVSHNRVDRTSGANGIFLSNSHGCLLLENTLYSAARDGIRLESSYCCKLYDNVVTDVSGAGIVLENTHDSLVLNNVVSEANADGIFVNGRRNQVDRNLAGSNFQFGLHFGNAAANCTFGRNTARGNAGGSCPTGGTPDFCDAGTNDSSFGDNFMPNLM